MDMSTKLHRLHLPRRLAGALLIAATCSSTCWAVQLETPSAASCTRVEVGPLVRIAVGKSSVIRPQEPIRRVVLGNPENSEGQAPRETTPAASANRPGASMGSNTDTRRPQVADVDVVLLSPREIYMLGKSIGSTNVVLVDQAGVCTVIDVAVGIDTTTVSATMQELLPAEHDIKVTSAADSLVLSGSVSDAAVADRVVDIANAFVRRSGAGGAGSGRPGEASDRVVNLMSVASPQQVMLEVKIAEVSKTLLDQFGMNITRAFASGNGTVVNYLTGIFGGTGLLTGSLSGAVGGSVGAGAAGVVGNGVVSGGITAPAGSSSLSSSSVTIPLAVGANTTQVNVNAQKTDTLVKTLAEPTVMAISGQEGSFLAGGTIFIPVAQGNGNGGSTITLEEKQFGIGLKFTPTVLGSGLISLKVNSEVSDLNSQGVSITAPGISGNAILPTFTVRRATTTVQLYDGQSFAIGGLIKNNVTGSLAAFPFLGELPILGALFRSQSFQTDRTELVVVITPRLAKPLPPNYRTPADDYHEPTRNDLYLKGRLEGSAPDPDPARDGKTASTSDFQVK